MNKNVRSLNYNYTFRYEDGYFARWGKTLVDDPDMSPFGPEILDIEISTICSQGCKFCSPDGTKVSTPNGEMNISELKKGDSVLSFNTNSNTIRENIIKETYSRQYDGDMIIITLANGKILKLTPEHEVFISNGILKQAKDLNIDDDIIDIES